MQRQGRREVARTFAEASACRRVICLGHEAAVVWLGRCMLEGHAAVASLCACGHLNVCGPRGGVCVLVCPTSTREGSGSAALGRIQPYSAVLAPRDFTRCSEHSARSRPPARSARINNESFTVINRCGTRRMAAASPPRRRRCSGGLSRPPLRRTRREATSFSAARRLLCGGCVSLRWSATSLRRRAESC